jgi:hypothetical protein
MEETPEEKWNRVQKKVQQGILTAYPNPNREGCPGSEVLLELAGRATKLKTLEGDERWEHVTHCSPCYKEYLEAREQVLNALRRRQHE